MARSPGSYHLRRSCRPARLSARQPRLGSAGPTRTLEPPPSTTVIGAVPSATLVQPALPGDIPAARRSERESGRTANSATARLCSGTLRPSPGPAWGRARHVRPGDKHPTIGHCLPHIRGCEAGGCYLLGGHGVGIPHMPVIRVWCDFKLPNNRFTPCSQPRVLAVPMGALCPGPGRVLASRHATHSGSGISFSQGGG